MRPEGRDKHTRTRTRTRTTHARTHPSIARPRSPRAPFPTRHGGMNMGHERGHLTKTQTWHTPCCHRRCASTSASTGASANAHAVCSRRWLTPCHRNARLDLDRVVVVDAQFETGAQASAANDARAAGHHPAPCAPRPAAHRPAAAVVTGERREDVVDTADLPICIVT